jgi:hypothetical protein
MAVETGINQIGGLGQDEISQLSDRKETVLGPVRGRYN